MKSRNKSRDCNLKVEILNVMTHIATLIQTSIIQAHEAVHVMQHVPPPTGGHDHGAMLGDAWDGRAAAATCCNQVMEKLSDYLDSEIASIMANIVPWQIG